MQVVPTSVAFLQYPHVELVEWLKRCPNPMPDSESSEIEPRQIFEAEDFGAEFTPEPRCAGGSVRRRGDDAAHPRPARSSVAPGSDTSGPTRPRDPGRPRGAPRRAPGGACARLCRASAAYAPPATVFLFRLGTILFSMRFARFSTCTARRSASSPNCQSLSDSASALSRAVIARKRAVYFKSCITARS